MSNWKLDDTTIVRNFNEDGYSKMPIDEYVARLGIELDMVKAARDRGESHVYERITKNKNQKMIVLTSFTEPKRSSGGVNAETVAVIAKLVEAGIKDPGQIAQVLAAGKAAGATGAPVATESAVDPTQQAMAQKLTELGF